MICQAFAAFSEGFVIISEHLQAYSTVLEAFLCSVCIIFAASFAVLAFLQLFFCSHMHFAGFADFGLLEDSTLDLKMCIAATKCSAVHSMLCSLAVIEALQCLK